MRVFLVGSLAVLIAASAAQAMTLDGLIDDWESAYILSDPGAPAGKIDVTRYGAKIVNEGGQDWLYTFHEVGGEDPNHTVDFWHDPVGGMNFFPSAYIDVDNTRGNLVAGADPNFQCAYGGGMGGWYDSEAWERYQPSNPASIRSSVYRFTDGSMTGMDVCVEYGVEAATELNHAIWLANNHTYDIGAQIESWNNYYVYDDPNYAQCPEARFQATYYDPNQSNGYILEKKVSLAQMQTVLSAAGNDGVTIGNVWKVGMGAQSNGGGTSWGYDVAPAFLIMRHPGDFDDDQAGPLGVEASDLDMLFAANGGTSNPDPNIGLSMYDMDHDGTVEAADDDLDVILAAVGTWRGDTDMDGDVDETDYGSLLLSWQNTGKAWGNGDFDGDGDVDETDYGSLLLSWQNGVTGVAGGPIPEPVTLSLLSLGGLALLRRRR